MISDLPKYRNNRYKPQNFVSFPYEVTWFKPISSGEPSIYFLAQPEEPS